ncbi:MAG: FAD-dependent thymidylate synthase [Firmicutes bacterium]|nr:FAD-dependent thymidylate synthase [Bacillota bacterium]
MKVVLLSHTPEPERLVAAAARVCYAEALPEEVLAGMTPEEIRSFLARLLAMDHLSPFEHASFTFAVSGVSRALTHELVRHRIASYSQRSQRYVKEEGFSFVTPPSIAAHPEASRIFAATMDVLRRTYAELLRLGIPREDARFVLPNACVTQIIVTMNARSLRNFFALRCCGRAQWEIRELAWRMLELVRRVAPGLFIDAGPPCEATGRCNQGKLSCGRVERKKREGEKCAD